MTRPIPMVADLPLDAVTWIRHRIVQRTTAVAVLGLDGDVQQRLGRASHEIEVAGIVAGPDSRDELAKLQAKASSGDEVPFQSDVTTALEVANCVVVEAEVLEVAGRPSAYEYRLLLRESPPLPPPVELSPLGGLGLGGLGLGGLPGGLDGLGLAGLGFDTDVLADIADLAAEAQGAIEAVADAVDQLQALAAIGDLALGSPLEPLTREAGKLASVGEAAGGVAALGELLGGS